MRPTASFLPLVILSAAILASSTGCTSTKSSESNARQLVRKGDRYYAGIWVPRDVERAAGLYKEAAVMGDPDALYLVGRCYDSGIGLPKNDSAATNYYARAAKEGNAEAQYRLGLAYSRGTGTPKNLLLGYLWLNRAASSGMEKAASSRDALGCRMSPSEITKAQKLSLEEGQAK